MANKNSPDTANGTAALDRLDKLDPDQYIVAFGPNGRQFLATPNGYSAIQLPVKVLSFLMARPVKKVTFASYGSHPDSWYFAFEMTNGKSTFLVGASIPPALREFVNRIRPFPELSSTLRVQLGSNDSFMAWANTSWACSGVPVALETTLCGLSSSYMRTRVTKGSLRGPLSEVAWNSDGSYYVKAQQGYRWHFESSVTREGWTMLWPERTATPGLEELSELVFVALDSHAATGDGFAFFKKQHDAEEAPFVIHFHGDITHIAGALKAAPAVQDPRLQHSEQKPDETKSFRWAICKRGGRPHASDSWELELQVGQLVKVWEDRGGHWFVVEVHGGMVGWAHGSRLAFCGTKMHKDPRGTYLQFQEDVRKLLVPGQLREFPPLSEYMDVCSNAACKPAKGSSQLGICVHDLQALLEGSSCYCYEWLKEERNMWHPDRFARFCHTDHREELKTSAQEVFVMYGVLMDMCRRQEE
ncbi:hypothetical protein SVAN01_02965 [Stagonosporopsis vannaccii]|nr:hypothetical protein SVAN01_02965 [Stagonosporopsis vannaccii]